MLIQEIIQTCELVAVSDVSNSLVNKGILGIIVGAVVGIAKAATNIYSANKAEKNAQRAADGYQGELDYLEENRQEVINPYEDMTNLSDMAVDLSSMATDLSGLITDTSGAISNPMANLSVSTAAAEMQAEESDIALANTLDTLMATGASAGGATALAQAALQSKKGVAATIEQQEKSNADKAAKGEERVQDAKMNEQKRIQNAQFSEASRIQKTEMSEAARLQSFGISEAGRMQQVDKAGALFMYQNTEDREVAELNRVATMLAGEKNIQLNASVAKSQAWADGIGDVASTDFKSIGEALKN